MNFLKQNKKSSYRFERKYHLNSGEHLLFQNFLQNNLFTKLYKSRKVNSIYYDSLNYDAFVENIEGISERQKARLRWYDDENLSLNLEIKKKKNQMNTKEIYHLNKFNNVLDLTLFLKNNNIQGEMFKIFKKVLFPVLKVSYFRDYWISKCKKYRATIDTKIKTSNIYNNYQFNKEINLDSNVLEYKYSSVDDKNFRKELLVKKNYFRIQKNSKYVNSFLAIKEAGQR